MRLLLYIACLPLICLLSSCVGHSPVRRFNGLVAEGRWLTAREMAEENLKQRPNDEVLKRAIAELNQKAETQISNSDFDPKKYFYAQAYTEFFSRKRYLKSVEAMEQVLSYELDNEEMLHFMDKAQPMLDEEQRRVNEELNRLVEAAAALTVKNRHAEALQHAQKALALSPLDNRARRIEARAQAALAQKPVVRQRGRGRRKLKELSPTAPPADPEWLQARFDESLKSYIKGDILTTRDILRELVAKAPDNEKFRSHLDRIEKELPPDRR